MRIKRVLATVLTSLTVASLAITPVMAAQRTETFYVYLGGGSKVSSGSAVKDVGGGMWYSVKEAPGTTITWVQGVETINLRGRTSGGTQCTTLAQRSTRGSGIMSYFSGYGSIGSYYKMAVQYDDSNPYQHLELQCSWIP
ncbi:MAG: hypothetical protein PHG16_06855 [Lachnospiraceae bacterium]|nr:hypothetical protein [Lachnospiraceae bacterium]